MLNFENTTISQGRNALELISILPGLRFNQKGGLTLDGREGLKVVENGRVLDLKGDELYRYLSEIRGENIRSVEVKHYAGAQYDADVSGVISIRTKRLTEAQRYFSLGDDTKFTTEGFIGTSPDLFFSMRKNKWNVYGNFSFSTVGSNDTDDEITDYKAENEGLRTVALLQTTHRNKRFSGRLGTIYELNKRNTLGIDVDASLLNMKIREVSITNESAAAAPTYSHIFSVYGMPDTARQVNSSLFYEHLFDEKGSSLKFSSDFYYHSKHSSEATDIYQQADSSLIGDWSSQGTQAMKRLSWVNKLDMSWCFSGKAKLDAGIKFFVTDMNSELLYDKRNAGAWITDPENTHITDYEERVCAIYADYSNQWQRWQLDAGLRYEQSWEKDIITDAQTGAQTATPSVYGNVFPSLMLRYCIDEERGHSAFFSYQSGIKRPTFQELTPYLKQINRYTQVSGNPDLSPEYSYLAAWGLTLASSYRFGLSASIVKDKIDWVARSSTENPLNAIYGTMNIPLVETYQLSAYLPFDVTPWWKCHIDLAGGYKRCRYASVWQYYARCNNLFNWKNVFDAELSASYLSTDIMGNEVMNPYYPVNFAIKRAFFNDSFLLSLYGNNIFRCGLDVDIETDSFRKNLVMRNSLYCQDFGISLRYIFNQKVRINTVDTGNAAERSR